MLQSYYAISGVPSNAEQLAKAFVAKYEQHKAVKKAFRQNSYKYNRDSENYKRIEAEKEESEESFKRVYEANWCLSDFRQRRTYDGEFRSARNAKSSWSKSGERKEKEKEKEKKWRKMMTREKKERTKCHDIRCEVEDKTGEGTGWDSDRPDWWFDYDGKGSDLGNWNVTTTESD
jgi:DnaJ-class molecular chaperone